MFCVGEMGCVRGHEWITGRGLEAGFFFVFSLTGPLKEKKVKKVNIKKTIVLLRGILFGYRIAVLGLGTCSR